MTQLTSSTFILILATLIVATESRATVFLRDDATGGDCAGPHVWDGSTKTCQLTGDVAESIEVDSSGVTLDCDGHRVSGPPGLFGEGILLPGPIFPPFLNVNDVTIRNCDISGSDIGILGLHNGGHTIENNTLHDNGFSGIFLFQGDGSNVIRDNQVSGSVFGIRLFEGGDSNRTSSNTCTTLYPINVQFLTNIATQQKRSQP